MSAASRNSPPPPQCPGQTFEAGSEIAPPTAGGLMQTHFFAFLPWQKILVLLCFFFPSNFLMFAEIIFSTWNNFTFSPNFLLLIFRQILGIFFGLFWGFFGFYQVQNFRLKMFPKSGQNAPKSRSVELPQNSRELF